MLIKWTDCRVGLLPKETMLGFWRICSMLDGTVELYEFCRNDDRWSAMLPVGDSALDAARAGPQPMTDNDTLLVPIEACLVEAKKWLAEVRAMAEEMEIAYSLPQGMRGRWAKGDIRYDDLGVLTDALNATLDKMGEGIYFDPCRGLCEETS